jgi:hypothetical protein
VESLTTRLLGILFYFFFVRPLVPTHCRCSGLLLHLITLNDTHTLSKTLLVKGWVHHRDLYLRAHNTHTRQTSMLHAPGRIRTCNPSKWAAADLCLTPCNHRDWLNSYGIKCSVLLCFTVHVTQTFKEHLLYLVLGSAIVQVLQHCSRLSGLVLGDFMTDLLCTKLHTSAFSQVLWLCPAGQSTVTPYPSITMQQPGLSRTLSLSHVLALRWGGFVTVWHLVIEQERHFFLSFMYWAS